MCILVTVTVTNSNNSMEINTMSTVTHSLERIKQRAVSLTTAAWV